MAKGEKATTADSARILPSTTLGNVIRKRHATDLFGNPTGEKATSGEDCTPMRKTPKPGNNVRNIPSDSLQLRGGHARFLGLSAIRKTMPIANQKAALGQLRV